MTTKQTLNAGWRISVDPHNQGLTEKWQFGIRADSMPAPVPGIVQQVFPRHEGVSWFWLSFFPEHLPGAGERAILKFAGADYFADVWLNGSWATRHEGADSPFEVDVTERVLAGDNLLAVRIVKPGSERIDGVVLDEIPHRNQKTIAHLTPGSSFNSAGIVAPVEYAVVPSLRIADIFACPDSSTGQIGMSVTVANDLGHEAVSRITVELTSEAAVEVGAHQVVDLGEVVLAAGLSTVEAVVIVANPRLWNLDDPYLYHVSARVGDSLMAVRCGFRDFRVVDGYFHLNGKRIFLRSSHTGNHYPIGQVTPVDPDHARRDLIMAKAAGFNCIRWIAGAALPEQLDFCDELGLMVYEETLASWCFDAGPAVRERYERSFDAVIRRDRNHPCVTIWGLINEMRDGEVFRCAVDYLPKLRQLDPTRLVLLGSGRWDHDFTVGSVSNPGSGEWEAQWGADHAGVPLCDPACPAELQGGYAQQAGDAHYYPAFPNSPESIEKLRTMGSGTRPVFLSEAGIGSLMNVIDDSRGFDRFDVPADLFDREYISNMAERFLADWTSFGMEDVYAFPVDLFRESYARHSEQRRLLFDMVRANPKFCGYNLTGLLDHAMTGEGLWSFWRRWKNGIVETLEDGWSPLRWCLFVTPPHGYAGSSIEVEAVLANEEVLRPGRYSASFRVWSASTGTVWERVVEFDVAKPGDLAFPVLKEQIELDLPSGEYLFAADLAHGGAPTGDRLAFQVSSSQERTASIGKLFMWGVNEAVCEWLGERGYTCLPYMGALTERENAVIVVGPVRQDDTAGWLSLRHDVELGARALFLSPESFKTNRANGPDPVPAHPWGGGITARGLWDWLYHRECVGKRHRVFDGLQTGGILDWRYWGEVVGHMWFDSPDGEIETMAAGFATGYCCAGGYDSGALIGRQRIGKGSALYNAFPVLDFYGKHPVADRLLRNLIAEASAETPVS
ncbi:MAG TPA: glycoside hydrolase family 2 TIM barrel-domain containing protein [Capsulimonadaceae bacterium]